MTVIPSPPVATSVALIQAYVASNHVPVTDMPGLVRLVHGAILALRDGSAAASDVARPGLPDAITIRSSGRSNGITSLIDGRACRMLNRHLTANNLNPTAHRARYGLPDDDEMSASAYCERRSRILESIGPGFECDDVLDERGRHVGNLRGRPAKGPREA